MYRITLELNDEELAEMQAYEGVTGKTMQHQLREALADYREVVIGVGVDMYFQSAIDRTKVQ
jgi:hypothetical protein